MKTLVKLTAAAAILAALPACDMLGGNRGASNATAEKNEAADDNGGESNSSSSDESEGNASASARGGKDDAGAGDTGSASSAGSSAPFTGEVTRAYLAGRWTDTGNCSDVTEFTRDGRFIANNGGGGIWSLNGDTLVFQGAQGARATLRVEAMDENTIVTTDENGAISRSTRC